MTELAPITHVIPVTSPTVVDIEYDPTVMLPMERRFLEATLIRSDESLSFLLVPIEQGIDPEIVTVGIDDVAGVNYVNRAWPS